MNRAANFALLLFAVVAANFGRLQAKATREAKIELARVQNTVRFYAGSVDACQPLVQRLEKPPAQLFCLPVCGLILNKKNLPPATMVDIETKAYQDVKTGSQCRPARTVDLATEEYNRFYGAHCK